MTRLGQGSCDREQRDRWPLYVAITCLLALPRPAIGQAQVLDGSYQISAGCNGPIPDAPTSVTGGNSSFGLLSADPLGTWGPFLSCNPLRHVFLGFPFNISYDEFESATVATPLLAGQDPSVRLPWVSASSAVWGLANTDFPFCEEKGFACEQTLTDPVTWGAGAASAAASFQLFIPTNPATPIHVDSVPARVWMFGDCSVGTLLSSGGSPMSSGTCGLRAQLVLHGAPGIPTQVLENVNQELGQAVFDLGLSEPVGGLNPASWQAQLDYPRPLTDPNQDAISISHIEDVELVVGAVYEVLKRVDVLVQVHINTDSSGVFPVDHDPAISASGQFDPIFEFDQAEFDARHGVNSFPLDDYFEPQVSANLYVTAANVCGDADADDEISGLDLLALRNALADPTGSPLSPVGLSRCKTISGAEPCGVRDAIVLTRAFAMPARLPGIQPVCSAALP